MIVFQDKADEIDEPKSARMNFRTKRRIKETIQQAAALSGVEDTTFAVNAAYRAAIETIAAHERTLLKPVDHAAFFEAMDNPPPMNARLLAAFDRHRKTVVSR